jgi:hypothetical protein
LQHRDDTGPFIAGLGFGSFATLWPMGGALSQLQLTPMVQPLASSQTLTLISSVRFAAIRAAPPKPRGGRTALAGGGVILKRNSLGFAEAVVMLAALRRVFNS